MSEKMPLSKIWIILKAVFFPILVICFDMLYSDLRVITQLITYTHKIFISSSLTTVNSTNNLFNRINEDSGAAGGTLILVMARLLYLFFISLAGLLWTPWLSSLKTSYKTSVSLLKEEVDMCTPPGKDSKW